jgi:formylglycine-generating enzyme required for sulfatase activity
MGAQKGDSSQPNYDPWAYDHESPVHEVSLDAFMIGRYPVTVGEFRRFAEEEGYSDMQWWKAGGYGQRKEPEGWDEQVLHPNRPVVGVSWYEAAAYCVWAGVRLPTEAEWEHAARGASGRKYPWGNEEPDNERANFAAKVGHPTPVGLYPQGATPEGIEDMAGNVWEWVADWYGTYPEAAAMCPQGPQSGDTRVLRVGGWSINPSFLRAAYRSRNVPGIRLVSVGFRCVREVLP